MNCRMHCYGLCPHQNSHFPTNDLHCNYSFIHSADENATSEAILNEGNLIEDIKFMCQCTYHTSQIRSVVMYSVYSSKLSNAYN